MIYGNTNENTAIVPGVKRKRVKLGGFDEILSLMWNKMHIVDCETNTKLCFFVELDIYNDSANDQSIDCLTFDFGVVWITKLVYEKKKCLHATICRDYIWYGKACHLKLLMK